MQERDVNAVLSSVLDEMLDIFQCDRAWLLYPCEPESVQWEVPIECTRRGWPGAFSRGIKTAMTPQAAELFRLALAVDVPVCFDSNTGLAVPEDVAQAFGVRSQMVMALRPQTGKPWLLGVHHCARAHVFEAMEQASFAQICRRIADALSSLLFLRNLRQSEAMLSEAQRMANIGSWRYDSEQDVLVWSDELYRIFGVQPRRHNPSFAFLYQTVHPEDRARVEAAHQGAVLNKTPFDIEYRLLFEDGSSKYVHERCRSFVAVGNGPATVIATLQDVTQRKRAEALERLRLMDLGHSERLVTMGEMAAQIAHELHQPLSAIRSYSDACLHMLRGGKPDTAKLADVLTKIGAQAQRAGQVVQRVQQFTQKHELRPVAVNVCALIRETLELMEAELKGRQIDFAVEAAEPLPQVRADKLLIQQVLLNLLRNACDAMQVCRPEQRRLTLRVQTPTPDYVCVSVQDNGGGLSPEAFERLFEAFYTTKDQGMGVGLALSRLIVESHGGYLWAEPRGGGGTLLHFTLPVAGLVGA